MGSVKSLFVSTSSKLFPCCCRGGTDCGSWNSKLAPSTVFLFLSAPELELVCVGDATLPATLCLAQDWNAVFQISLWNLLLWSCSFIPAHAISVSTCDSENKSLVTLNPGFLCSDWFPHQGFRKQSCFWCGRLRIVSHFRTLSYQGSLNKSCGVPARMLDLWIFIFHLNKLILHCSDEVRVPDFRFTWS